MLVLVSGGNRAMRFPAAVTTACTLGLLALVVGFREPAESDSCAVKLRLIEADSGREIAGLVRITDGQGNVLRPVGLLCRGLGLPTESPISQWYVLAEPRTVSLPRGELTIEAIAGLEFERTRVPVDLRERSQAELTLKLVRFDNPAGRGERCANTHLHLQKITRETADRYLREVPRGDHLDMVFLSYLERAVADREYISNTYRQADLEKLTKASGVRFGNGEEHRHNFTGFGEGYGHVMLLNIRRLIQPVSIGPGIMKMGTDGLPLARGIDEARRQGGTVLWCHNEWGMESIPAWVTGRIDAQNIFDGGIRSSYEDSFYRYLDAGLAVPFSTGTDWFQYDFSRTYVRTADAPTVAGWLSGLKAGRSYITNGPLLEFRCEQELAGGTIDLDSPRTVEVVADARGRVNFEWLELVHNGRVIDREPTHPVAGHFEARLRRRVEITEPGWLAVRTPPPPVPDDPLRSTPVPLNEFGRPLFAHTSPVYVTIRGRRRFVEGVAREMLAEIDANMRTISEKGVFADDLERQRVLDVHREARRVLEMRLQRRDR